MIGCHLSVLPAVFARKTMPVTELLNNCHQRSNLLLTPWRRRTIQTRTPPTQSPNCTFRKRYNLFRSRTKRHLQSNDWTKAHFDSRCVPRCFEPGQFLFFLVILLGICLRQTYGPSKSPDTLARRRFDKLMNVSRAIYRGPGLLRTSRGTVFATRASVGDFDFKHSIYCRAESKRNLGHDSHRTSRFATSLSVCRVLGCCIMAMLDNIRFCTRVGTGGQARFACNTNKDHGSSQ